MPDTLVAPPNIDLGREIEKHRTRLTQLESLQQEQNALMGRVRLVMSDQPTPGVAAVQVQEVSRRKAKVNAKNRHNRKRTGKTLGQTMFEILTNKGPGVALTIKEAIDLAAGHGFKSDSNQPQTVMRQMFQRDDRFKKIETPGERTVRFALAG